MASDLAYQEKCECAKNQFCAYISQSDIFSNSEKSYLKKVILKDNISGILYVSSVLAAWAVIAGIIESILFPSLVVFAFFHGHIDYKVLAPPVLFLIFNLLLKLIYIWINLNGKVKRYDILISSLPYIGSAYLLKKFLINDRLLSKAIYAFLRTKKQGVKNKILKRLKRK